MRKRDRESLLGRSPNGTPKRRIRLRNCLLVLLITLLTLLATFIVFFLAFVQNINNEKTAPVRNQPQKKTSTHLGGMVIHDNNRHQEDQKGRYTNKKVWEDSYSYRNNMPAWMKEYFEWHTTERKRLEENRDEWKHCKFIMLQCLPGSRKCGGTADRLKPLPLFLLLAHRTKRLLLIKWGRPAELEEFLLPPRGGIDWRVPQWLYDIQEFRNGPRATHTEGLIGLMENPDFPTVKARLQAHDHGAPYYNEQRISEQEPTFDEVYHLCWHTMFTPAPAIARLIHDQMLHFGLEPGRYVGIHVRALYAVQERSPAMVQHWSRNALNCASQLQPGGPFYISSDSEFAVKVGVDYGKERNVLVASRTLVDGVSHAQPYHLDKAPRSAKAIDFYDTFVDLYLLALSRCITYNMGGFGTWALYISPFANDKKQNPTGSCSFQHHEAAGIHKCDWNPGPLDGGSEEKDTLGKKDRTVRGNPLLLPSMASEP